MAAPGAAASGAGLADWDRVAYVASSPVNHSYEVVVEIDEPAGSPDSEAQLRNALTDQ